MKMTFDEIKETLYAIPLKDCNEDINVDWIIAIDRAIDIINKYQIMQKTLEKTLNIPVPLLDKAKCLDEIMETYKLVR